MDKIDGVLMDKNTKLNSNDKEHELFKK